MKAIYTILCFMLLVSCGEKDEKDNQKYLPDSNGVLNNISVVSDNLLWEGNVGENIRSIFAVTLEGLPNDEPMFSMRQIPTQVFDGFAARSRIVLKIEKGADKASTSIAEDAFAKPQTIVIVKGKTDADIITQLKANKDKIIDAFNKEEVKEKQRQIKKSLLNDTDMETKLGFTINIPSIYKIAKSSEDFFWLRKNLKINKTVELMFYELPLESISKEDSTIVDIVRLRNEITKTKIVGEEGIYMSVQNAYAPSLYKTIIDNKPAYEVRGLWELNGYTGAGPFITYLIEDKINNRYLVADGLVYAPSLDKRSYIFELESIIKSITIK